MRSYNINASNKGIKGIQRLNRAQIANWSLNLGVNPIGVSHLARVVVVSKAYKSDSFR